MEDEIRRKMATSYTYGGQGKEKENVLSRRVILMEAEITRRIRLKRVIIMDDNVKGMRTSSQRELSLWRLR